MSSFSMKKSEIRRMGVKRQGATETQEGEDKSKKVGVLVE